MCTTPCAGNHLASGCDHQGMGCDPYRELISADLDGEADDAERATLAAHLATCAGCTAFAAEVGRIHRASRVVVADSIPDLTDAIVERATADPTVELIGVGRPPAPARRPTRSRVAVLAFQYGLLVVALLMVVLAAPDLLASSGDAVHVSRHLGGWDVAFAIGLILAAVQPWRARGLLPMAAALAGVMVVTAAFDIARGSTPGLAEGTHLLEVFGLVFLWLLARSMPAGERPRRGLPIPTEDRGTGSPATRLRSLPTRFGMAVRPAPTAATDERSRAA